MSHSASLPCTTGLSPGAGSQLLISMSANRWITQRRPYGAWTSCCEHRQPWKVLQHAKSKTLERRMEQWGSGRKGLGRDWRLRNQKRGKRPETVWLTETSELCETSHCGSLGWLGTEESLQWMSQSLLLPVTLSVKLFPKAPKGCL